MEWACGIIGVDSRRASGHLGRTMRSCESAGWHDYSVFLDGEMPTCSRVGIVPRETTIGAFGNWWLGAVELYIRQPHADRFVIFQDDIECPVGLREYLCHTTTHDMAYWNLCTYSAGIGYPTNVVTTTPGWQPALCNWGLGAQGLVFTNEGLRTLLSSRVVIDQPMDKYRGKEAIDGIVKTALGRAGFTEMVHNPTLVNHVGTQSTIGHEPQPESYGWRGADWNVMELLTNRTL